MHFLRPALFVVAASCVSGYASALQSSSTDVCVDLDASLTLAGLAAIKLDLCLCVRDVLDLINANVELKLAADVLGVVEVQAAIEALINTSKDVQYCTYPPYSYPVCSAQYPCGFNCHKGFHPYPKDKPTECRCNGYVCNGRCSAYPCSSQVAKRGALWQNPGCPRGWKQCGVWGNSQFDYECVDVRRDLWSCGNCGIPLRQGEPAGVDCTAIPGVREVACMSSRCVVQRCTEGFEVSEDQATCLPVSFTRVSDDRFFLKNGDGFSKHYTN